MDGVLALPSVPGNLLTAAEGKVLVDGLVLSVERCARAMVRVVLFERELRWPRSLTRGKDIWFNVTAGKGPTEAADVLLVLEVDLAVFSAVNLAHATLLLAGKEGVSPTLTMGWSGNFLDVVLSIREGWSSLNPSGWLRLRRARLAICMGRREVDLNRSMSRQDRTPYHEGSTLVHAGVGMLLQIVRSRNTRPIPPGAVGVFLAHLEREANGLPPAAGYLGLPGNVNELERMLLAYASVWGE